MYVDYVLHFAVLQSTTYEKYCMSVLELDYTQSGLISTEAKSHLCIACFFLGSILLIFFTLTSGVA